MNYWRLLSSVVTLFGPVAVLVYDLVAFYVAGREATITSVVRTWSDEYHELPWFAAGLFLWVWCHFFLEGLIARLHR